jgi:hypothetical protein
LKEEQLQPAFLHSFPLTLFAFSTSPTSQEFQSI